MDMCDACTDRQQWLLDLGDGSQVICLCQVENSQVEDEGKVATTIDVGIQTPPPVKRSSPSIPNAPKRARKMSNIPIDEEYESILKQKIFTTHPDLYNDKDFNEIIEAAKMWIEDKTFDKEMFIIVNKKLSNDFTYKDLEDEILQAYANVSKGRKMKFNIEFSILLQNIRSKEYHYLHAPAYHTLFNRPKTIFSRSDIKAIIKEIYNKNITEHYSRSLPYSSYFSSYIVERYLMLRPTSSWTLVSITNVYFKLF